jgi:hypothetical protein
MLDVSLFQAFFILCHSKLTLELKEDLSQYKEVDVWALCIMVFILKT